MPNPIPNQAVTSASQATPLRLGVTNLSFHRATAAIVVHVLDIMGKSVQLSFADHQANFDALGRGELDLLCSAWLPHSHGIYLDKVRQNLEVRELGLHYEPYALWGVPEYVPQEQVDSVTDLLRPDVLKKMRRHIQGIGPGAGISRFSKQMMQDYGLQRAGYEFHTGTEQQCFDAFEDALQHKAWAVVPLWQPQFLHHKYKIRELKDPKGLLGGKDRAVLLLAENAAGHFTQAQLRVLDNIRMLNRDIAELDYAINREGLSAEEAAGRWLSAHPVILSQWLSPLWRRQTCEESNHDA